MKSCATQSQHTSGMSTNALLSNGFSLGSAATSIAITIDCVRGALRLTQCRVASPRGFRARPTSASWQHQIHSKMLSGCWKQGMSRLRRRWTEMSPSEPWTSRTRMGKLCVQSTSSSAMLTAALGSSSGSMSTLLALFLSRPLNRASRPVGARQ